MKRYLYNYIELVFYVENQLRNSSKIKVKENHIKIHYFLKAPLFTDFPKWHNTIDDIKEKAATVRDTTKSSVLSDVYTEIHNPIISCSRTSLSETWQNVKKNQQETHKSTESQKTMLWFHQVRSSRCVLQCKLEYSEATKWINTPERRRWDRSCSNPSLNKTKRNITWN